MKKRFMSRVLAVVGISAALTAVAMPANASLFTNNYNVIMGAIQAPAYTNPDTKSITNRDGRVYVQAVGSAYKADAVMCGITYVCQGGTKVYGLDDNSYANLRNTYAAGNNPRMELRSNGQNFSTNIQVQGWWFSG